MEDNKKLNTIALLYDIINQYTTELSKTTKQGIKMLTKRSDDDLRLLIKEFDKLQPEKDQESFGEDADNLRRIIDTVLMRKR